MDTFEIRSILGLLLAGGYLTYCRGASKDYVRATLNAGVGHRDFLEEKVAEIRQFVPTKAEIKPYLTPIRESGKRTTVLRFRFSSNALRPIYNLLYPCREREITRAVLELLGGRAAAWLWAEGARLSPDGSAVLSHVGTLQEEAQLIRGWLQLLTGVDAAISQGGGSARPRLYFSADDTRRLQTALLPYAPNSRRRLFEEG